MEISGFPERVRVSKGGCTGIGSLIILIIILFNKASDETHLYAVLATNLLSSYSRA